MEHVCKICDKQLNNEHQFRQHMKEHMKKYNQLVNYHYCDFLTNDAAKYISHIGDMHSPKFKCETCGEEFYDIKTKLEHVMVVHAFNYTTQGETSELVECFDCGEQLSSKLNLMNHKKSKHYKTKLCSFFHGNMTTCIFPDQKCMNIHNENIRPTVTGDHRSRIICQNGSQCFFLSQPGGCLYKHVQSVQQKQNVWQQPRVTRDNTRATPSTANVVQTSQQPVAQSVNTPKTDTNQLVMNLCKQMETISLKLQFSELKSMTDFPSLG